MRYIKTCL